MRRIFVIWLISIPALAGAARAAEGEPRAAAKPACFPAAETREEIKAHHLVEPFAVLKAAQAQQKAEALSAKLCRIGDEFVYEIAFLHRDGRYFHVLMNAVTGKPQETRRAREAAPHETPAKP